MSREQPLMSTQQAANNIEYNIQHINNKIY